MNIGRKLLNSNHNSPTRGFFNGFYKGFFQFIIIIFYSSSFHWLFCFFEHNKIVLPQHFSLAVKHVITRLFSCPVVFKVSVFGPFFPLYQKPYPPILLFSSWRICVPSSDHAACWLLKLRKQAYLNLSGSVRFFVEGINHCSLHKPLKAVTHLEKYVYIISCCKSRMAENYVKHVILSLVMV